MAEVRYLCPGFSGKKEEYEDWRVRVDDWVVFSQLGVKDGEKDLKAITMAVEIRMALKGKALEATKHIERSKLQKVGGERIILERLDQVYRKDKVTEVYSKVRSLLKIERGSEEPMEDYLNRYDRLAGDCEKEGIDMLKGEMKGCHVLEQAGLDENQKQMVLAACGQDKLEYERIRRVMKRIFEGLGSKEKEEEWWEKGRGIGYKNQGRGELKSYERGEKNPTRYGKTTRCVVCSSEYHWARECPKSYRQQTRGRGGRGGIGQRMQAERSREEKGHETEEEKVFLEKKEEKDSHWLEVEAILDTGCNSSVIGEL